MKKKAATKAKPKTRPSDGDVFIRIKPDFHDYLVLNANYRESIGQVIERVCGFERKPKK